MKNSSKSTGLHQVTDQSVVCIIGLGYVGLPLAEGFSKKLKVIGFDINTQRVNRLKQISHNTNLTFSTNPEDISQADFVIICVPTPVTKTKDPDLSFVRSAAETVSRHMKKDSIVILESTVYPGVTEEIVKPILEESGLKCGQDFKIAYSPERINPGDEEHTIDKVTKVISGMDMETTDIVAELYGKIAHHIFRAKDIKTAEAAKVIENIQRDLNIALVNELTLIFEKMGLSIIDILNAAATKWNFHTYSPGIVGGHCIPVDPYYLVYKAKELGYHPQVILAGRAINDYMPKHIAEMTIKALNNTGKVIKDSRILVMGLTYKENVADTRETPVKDIIKELQEYGVKVFAYDPLVDRIEENFGVEAVTDLESMSGVDGVILVVAHQDFRKITLNVLKKITKSDPVLVDIRGFYDKEQAVSIGFNYRRL